MQTLKLIKIVCLVIFLGAVVVVLNGTTVMTTAHAFSIGPPAASTGAPGELTCASCHSGPPNNGQFTIEAPASYAPGQTVEITVRHTSSDTSRKRWGFQLTALTSANEKVGTLQNNGTLSLVDNSGPGGSRQYIQHNLAGTFSGQTGGASWTFTWVAPSSNVGPVTLYACGNQANNDGTNGGDQIYTASVIINAPSLGLPGITGAAVNGKQLVVSGLNFDIGAVLLVDGARQKKTVNDDVNPSTMLVAKKSGKSIAHGASVTLQVRNLDARLSEPFTFTRP